MENNIKFTIITASYNYENYIKEAIESVLNQTYPNWEMLVIDDGSKDNSVNIINEYCQKNERIKLLQHENGCNKGLAETVQLGIKNANGNWIVFLESDDSLTPDYLEKKLAFIISNPKAEFIFSDNNIIGSKEKIEAYEDYKVRQQKRYLKHDFHKNQTKYMKKFNIIPTFSCVALKKEIMENINFNSPVRAALDYYLWLQLSKKTKFLYLDEKLTNWRRHEGSYITTHKEKGFKAARFEYEKFKITANSCEKLLLPIFYLKYIITGLRKTLFKFNLKRKTLTILGKEINF